MTRRHPEHALLTNPNDRAPPSGAPDPHRHSLPLRSTAQRRTPDAPDAACRCVPRNIRSQLTSAKPRIPCACHDFATPNARPHTRFVARGHEIQRFCRPRTIHCACHADPPSRAFPSTSMHPKSHTCHAKRRSQRVKSRARATRPGTQSARHSAADTARGHAPDMLLDTRSP